MTLTSATRTIEELRKLFNADEFRAFMNSNDTKQIKSAPYQPATNGLVERFVQTLKQALRAAMTKKKSLSQKLANFLLAYRTTPHAMTGETLAMFLMGRNIRTRLDVLKPSMKVSGREIAGPRAKINPQPHSPTGCMSSCCCPKLPCRKHLGAWNHHSPPWNVVLRNQRRTQYSLAATRRSTQRVCHNGEP